jgi:hypothetical protein
MKESIVTFDTAKLAKEKGFEPGSYSYSYNQEGSFMPQTRIYQGLAAPSQSLLQKWLRDEHQIHIEVVLYDNSRTYHWEYRVVTSKDRDWNDIDCFDSAKRHYNKEEFVTFEESLEKGLQKALKLI